MSGDAFPGDGVRGFRARLLGCAPPAPIGNDEWRAAIDIVIDAIAAGDAVDTRATANDHWPDLVAQVTARARALHARARYRARNARLARDRAERAAQLQARKAQLEKGRTPISKNEVLEAIARARAKKLSRAPKPGEQS